MGFGSKGKSKKQGMAQKIHSKSVIQRLTQAGKKSKKKNSFPTKSDPSYGNTKQAVWNNVFVIYDDCKIESGYNNVILIWNEVTTSTFYVFLWRWQQVQKHSSTRT